MTSTSIYKDIAERTGGDIYIGVVGPVRTGKSTFIKKFMENAVIPNIEDVYKRDRAQDELPQSAAGRTIMTTEPKFIPNEAIQVRIDDNVTFRTRLIDCVGYIVPSALGYIEDDCPRMVRTPWFDEPVPFNMAAEVGTQKVISEHSTIGLVITTDGSISEIPREDYVEAEQRVVSELKELGKPFIVVLNSADPYGDQALSLADDLRKQYGVEVIPVDCLRLTDEDIRQILSSVLSEFPIREIRFDLPRWICSLPSDHWLRASVFNDICEAARNVRHIRQAGDAASVIAENENIESAAVSGVSLGEGAADIKLTVNQKLFYRIVTQTTGVELDNDGDLIRLVTQLAASKQNYDKVSYAIQEADSSGYGIVTPSLDELTLEEPEIVKQGSRYGVRLKAAAPSYHIIKANIETEVSPIVGSEKQSEELVRFLLTGFEEDPKKIWESNIFGKSLSELVNEGLHTKLNKMPTEARQKMQSTLERIINEGSSGLICIIL